MRRNPEIPRDIFFGSASEAEPEPAAPATVPPPGLRTARATDEGKVQVTVYLSEAVAKRLEVLRFHLLNEYDIKVPKSAIAEYAIAQLGEDLAPLAAFFGRGA